MNTKPHIVTALLLSACCMQAVAQKADTTALPKHLKLLGITCGIAVPMHDFSSKNAKFGSVAANGNSGFYNAGALAKQGVAINASYSLLGYQTRNSSFAFSACMGYYYNPFDMNTFLECAKESYQLENSPEEWTTTSSSYSGGYSAYTATLGFQSGIYIHKLAFDAGVYAGAARLSIPGVSYTADVYYPAIYTYSVPVNYSVTASSAYAFCVNAYFALRYKISNKLYALANASYMGAHFTGKVTYTDLANSTPGTISIHYLQAAYSLGIEYKLGK